MLKNLLDPMKKGPCLFLRQILLAAMTMVCGTFLYSPPLPAEVEHRDSAARRKADDIPIELKAPLFPKKAVWLNGPGPGKEPFKGRTTLVYFWDFATINCIRERKHIEKLFTQYHPYGFEIISVHSPEFKFAKDKKQVEAAMRRLKMDYVTMVDNDFELWDSYQNRSWPSKHLVNGEGLIVYSQAGEGSYQQMENQIRTELQKTNAGAVLPEPVFAEERDDFNIWECGEMSGEVYIGYKRASWWGIEIANRKGIQPDQTALYKDRGERSDRSFFLEGKWGNFEEYFEHLRATEEYTDYLGILYIANEVYAVLENLAAGKPPRVYVKRDNVPVPRRYRGKDLAVDLQGETYFLLNQARIYYLIANDTADFHELRLYVKDPRIAVYSFAFSNQCLADFEHL